MVVAGGVAANKAVRQVCSFLFTSVCVALFCSLPLLKTKVAVIKALRQGATTKLHSAV